MSSESTYFVGATYAPSNSQNDISSTSVSHLQGMLKARVAIHYLQTIAKLCILTGASHDTTRLGFHLHLVRIMQSPTIHGAHFCTISTRDVCILSLADI